MLVQFRFATGLTSGDYVRQQAWEKASLACCPLHPGGGCGFARHGTYGRKDPPGTRIARYYCPTGHATFGLLPDCLPSRLPGTMRAIEETVVVVESVRSCSAAADTVRTDIELPGALRWLRRRRDAVHANLTTLIGLQPAFFAGWMPTVTDFRARLQTRRALVALRDQAQDYLPNLPPPLGFGPRSPSRSTARARSQQLMGPAPAS